MKLTLWGTRGSIACSAPENEIYGGNTSCVEVEGNDGTILVLDAGTGIRRLGVKINNTIKRVDILLTHFHLDHIQGLGFFLPLFNPNIEVHIYGPAKNDRSLHQQLARYLSPPLFPVLLRDLPCKFYLHAIPRPEFALGQFTVTAQMLCHPGLTVGYRISSKEGAIAYIPDHEPLLGSASFPKNTDWISGYDIACGVDFLLHDAQYSNEEYQRCVGWGHSTVEQTLEFAKVAKIKSLITFHHDPSHDDKRLDAMLKSAIDIIKPNYVIHPGHENDVFTLGH